MKTIKNLSKALAICAVLIFNISVYSQETNEQKSMFLRVYNLEGTKISKGHLFFTNDSVLVLKRGEKIINVRINDIGKIKTKRSRGNNVLTASLVGGVAGALIGAATSQEETKTADGGWLFGEYEYTSGTSPGTGAAIGGGIGLAGGAIIGLGSSLFKKQETFVIDGDINKWRIFKEFIEE